MPSKFEQPQDYPPNIREAFPSGLRQTQYAMDVARDLAASIGPDRPTYALLDAISAQIAAFEQALPNYFPARRFSSEVFELLQQELKPEQAEVVLRWALTRQAQSAQKNRPK